jgi:hypothetical protein
MLKITEYYSPTSQIIKKGKLELARSGYLATQFCNAVWKKLYIIRVLLLRFNVSLDKCLVNGGF